MASRFYIYESKSDWSGTHEVIREEAYYGPFLDFPDAKFHLNDAFADYLEAQGADVIVVALSDAVAATNTINSREFWMDQLAQLERSNNA